MNMQHAVKAVSVLGILAILMLLACGQGSPRRGGDGEPSCEAGSVGCDCYGNGTCDEELECRADRCIDPEALCEDGSLDCICYGNGSCDGDLECRDDICVPSSEEPGGDGPTVVGLTGPRELTNATGATFEFSCSAQACSFECDLDDGGFEACDAGVTYADVSDGDHVFMVVATNADGESGPRALWAWTVDTVAPTIEMSGAPVDSTESTAAFEFECGGDKDCTFECTLDINGASGVWQSCSSAVSFDELEPGDYVFRLRATDGAGNQAEHEHGWKVLVDGWLTVNAAWTHTCAITSDGALWCWGENDHGQLGNDTIEESPVPVRVGAERWVQVSGGTKYTCGIQADQSLWCWGRNPTGQLGHGDTAEEHVPTRVGTWSDWTQVVAGDRHTCAIRADGSTWCWGDGWAGRVGDGTDEERHVPTPVSSNFAGRQVSAAQGHTCAIDGAGTLWCWGSNAAGQIGLGAEENALTPVQLLDGWRQVATGGWHTCAVRENGALSCTGLNSDGQLGENTATPERTSFTVVGSSMDWQEVSSGIRHTCGLRTDKGLWCWGDNRNGRLGDGTFTMREVPTRIAAGVRWFEISAGRATTCGIQDDKSLWCWGDNARGQVGDGTYTVRPLPVEIAVPD